MKLHKKLDLSDEYFVSAEYKFTFEYLKYAQKVFGISRDDARNLTDAGWANRDNSARGAAQRLLYLLKYGEALECIDDEQGYEYLTLENWDHAENTPTLHDEAKETD